MEGISIFFIPLGGVLYEYLVWSLGFHSGTAAKKE